MVMLYACLWKKKYKNPKLAYKEQTNLEAETHRHEIKQGKDILYKYNKEIEAKRFGLGFLGINMCAYI